MKASVADLQEAARQSRLTIPLEVAMQCPVLAYCLNKTALIAAKRRSTTPPSKPDFKRLAAGDID